MKFITADYLHNGKKFLPQGTCLVIENDKIKDILAQTQNENVQHFKGLVCPGFINVHCHLELSYLKNIIPQHTGLVNFVLDIQKHRDGFTDQQIQEAIQNAEQEMLQNGIVAVGDICNTNYTVTQKQKKNLYYHNFIECVGVLDNNAKQRFNIFNELKNEFIKANLTPHAPYSLSKNLFELINEASKNEIISIHNQESQAENELFLRGSGSFLKLYQTMFGNEYVPTAKEKSSLQFFLPYLKDVAKIILVHNTFTTQQDIDFVKHNNITTYWCTCPKANLYIENTLPNYSLHIANNLNICIGTDSLASNNSLDIWSEIETIKNNTNYLEYETLIRWATHNGAMALGIESEFGSFEKGKSAKFFCNQNF